MLCRSFLAHPECRWPPQLIAPARKGLLVGVIAPRGIDGSAGMARLAGSFIGVERALSLGYPLSSRKTK